MRKLLLYFLFIAFLSSCSNATQDNKPEQPAEESTGVTSDIPVSPVTPNATAQVNTGKATPKDAEAEDCIFDQATQTDEFLRVVAALKGYKWNQETRTASFLLPQGDTLLISRGGCEHFTVSVEFRLRNDKTDYTKWSNVFSKALWIAKVLDHEFNYEELKSDIEANRINFSRYEETGTDVISFSEETLTDRNYTLERHLQPGLQKITLSYTIN
ncbi:hypothetical protein [Pontibacter ruber]|uniref:Lipoprotein n=1 Tax=Pontibacter ruber TaxID=1343895 RepID=A0ABW5CTM1_9BACT|nr:hypothetical protein [Pontibacter ruber]